MLDIWQYINTHLFIYIPVELFTASVQLCVLNVLERVSPMTRSCWAFRLHWGEKKTFVCRCFYHHHFYYLKEQIFLNIYLLTSLLVVILELLYLSNGLVEMARWTPHLGKTYRGRQWAVVEGYLHPNCSLERLSNTRSINQEGISIHVSLTAKLSRILPI